MTLPVDRIRARLSRCTRVGNGWKCQCPAHDDRENSLKLDRGDEGQALVYCHAGCETARVMAAIGYTLADLYPESAESISRNGKQPAHRLIQTRRYEMATALSGAVAFHVREDYDDGKKSVWWEMPDGTRRLIGIKLTDFALYGIDEVGDSNEVVIVEGEKARDAGQTLGVPFVGTVTGASATPCDASLHPLLGLTIYLWPDHDDPGRTHMERIAQRLLALGQPADKLRRITWDRAPEHGDVADWVEAGGTAAVLRRTRLAEARLWFETGPTERAYTLEEVVSVYRKWLYLPDDDEGPVYVALGVIAANLLDADPVWLLIVGPSSGGKTEIINPLANLPFAHAAATLTEASLLSGTPKQQTARGSKGGLLREIGEFGVLVLKDFTSILSMNRDARAALLAALREIFDGAWTRHVGADGGKELSWKGKLGVIGACTAAIDTHHSVMAVMGERFLLYRMPAIDPHEQAMRALSNVGNEREMRAELSAAVRGLFSGINVDAEMPTLSDHDMTGIAMLASLVASARSAVERDSYRREIELVIDTEGPARLAQTLRRLYAGMVAIGVPRETAWALVCKTGIDCIPKLRRSVLNVLMNVDRWLTTTEIATAAGYPTVTIRRALEDLAAHGVVDRQSGGPGKADQWITSDLAQSRLKTTFSEVLYKGKNAHDQLFKFSNIPLYNKTEKVGFARNGAEFGVDTDFGDPFAEYAPDERETDGETHCWRCRVTVPSNADRCPSCNWLVCVCGACSRECAYGGYDPGDAS